MRYRAGALAALCLLAGGVAMAADWTRDFAAQPVAARPRLEARYTDASRTAFVIEAERYRLTFDLHSKRGQGLREIMVGGRNLVGDGGAWVEAVAGGKTYSSRRSLEPSRVNLYRRGPYYTEVHWLDMALSAGPGDALPIKGEVVFHCYPEKVHLSVLLHVTGPVSADRAALVLNFPRQRHHLHSQLSASSLQAGQPGMAFPVSPGDSLLVGGEDGELVLLWPAPGAVDSVVFTESVARGYRVENRFLAGAWKAGDVVPLHLECLPLPAKLPHQEREAWPENERQPLPIFTAVPGTALGYDPVRGCYRVHTDNPGGFSYHYQHPNDYETARVTLANDSRPRKVYLCHDTGANPGSVECGVVLDEAGHPLPLLVQASKNFAGEKEEPFYNPQDTPFSETFFPLYLAPGETRTFTSLHLYQNWGNHPLKQFSSLGAWMDYYHMSTGVTETTCYVPFKFGGLPGVDIADLRPMSGTMWTSQPQHDNVAGHSFLGYFDGAWHYLDYLGTTFHSTGPNWAWVTLRQRSDDGKVAAALDVFEFPQPDELRSFVHLRYDFTGPFTIVNAREHLRLLNITTAIQSLRYQRVAWSGAAGVQTRPLPPSDGFTLAGEPLAGEAPFAALYACPHGNNAYVVRRFAARLGGKEGIRPAVSVYAGKDGNAILMLVPDLGRVSIRPGDYVEADLMLMPYGTERDDWQPAAREAERYGAHAPRVVAVSTGKKLSDFPVRVQVEGSGETQFAIEGGYGVIPLLVEGARRYDGVPHLMREEAPGRWVLVEHSHQGYDGHQLYVTPQGTFGMVFLLHTDGSRQHLRAWMGGKALPQGTLPAPPAP